MSTPKRRRLEALIAIAWLVALAVSIALWRAFRDPAALPPPGSAAARLLALLGSVPYDDPGVVARVRATRVAVLATFGAAGAVAFLEIDRVLRTVVRFFLAESHPLNLAVFRIVLFYRAYRLAWFDYIAQVAALPVGLQVPPQTAVPSIGPLAALERWPLHVLTPAQVETAGHVMVAACVTGMLGVLSRTSALVVAVTFFYGWGAMQWFGKVDHHHHVLWFALILAASRCSDALSIDALVRAWRRGRSGVTEPAREDVAYGIALRMVMLSMGVLYFWPGLWKIWRSGFDWFAGDSAVNQIYLKWHMIGGWMPFARVDLHPWLVHGGALGTIIFELSFILLIFGAATRVLAAILGVTFHTALDVFMRHGFESLRACYVVFVNWHGLLRRIGRRAFPHAVRVEFDGRDTRTATAVAMVRTLDWLERIVWVNTSAAGRAASAPGSGGVTNKAAGGLLIKTGGGIRFGAGAWAAIAVRVPLLWPLVPLLWALAWVTATRVSIAAAAPAPVAAARAASTRVVPAWATTRSAWSAAAVGMALVLANASAGARRLQDAWPIACYPLFDGLIADSYTTLEVTVVGADGVERKVVPHDYIAAFGNRWTHMLLRILDERDEEVRRRQLRLMWEVLARHDSALAGSRHVRFFTVRSWIAPDRWGDPPADPELIYEVDL